MMRKPGRAGTYARPKGHWRNYWRARHPQEPQAPVVAGLVAVRARVYYI